MGKKRKETFDKTWRNDFFFDTDDTPSNTNTFANSVSNYVKFLGQNKDFCMKTKGYKMFNTIGNTNMYSCDWVPGM